MYIQSDNIEVFPTTKRADTYTRTSKMMSEQAFTRIVNQLVDRDSFVISFDNNSDIIEFNIHGYYFKIKNVSAIKDSITSDNIYAYIVINDKVENDNQYIELQGQDESDKEDLIIDGTIGDKIAFTGLTISESDPTTKTAPKGCTIYALKILTYKDGSFKVPDESYILYNSNSIKISEIFGGEIE